ncbi:reverse transcriptase/maturase family protein [Nocardia sp. CA-107356]|uniref:reverse transcriptase/maturase family protein n=1 Tax=Nocardia sp. CA-107356 TaxID=3239972 RepID=UPI003D8BB017
MQSAGTVLGVLRERGRRGLPLHELYRQLFNPELYLLAYGNIYSNKGAMTPRPDGETADGVSRGKIDRIIDAMRHERYRFRPVQRVYIPKKNGKLRPLGMPPWSDKLVGEVIRLLLEAYYEPQFSGRSHGFRRGRGCHSALSEVAETWTGTTWFIESDISDCFGSFGHEVMLSILAEKIRDNRFLRLIKQMLQAGYLGHDLLLGWKPLADWLDGERSALLVRGRTAADSSEWIEADRHPSLLYRGLRLATAMNFLDDADEVVVEFLRESSMAEQSERPTAR